MKERESKQEIQRTNTKKKVETEGIVWQAQHTAFGEIAKATSAQRTGSPQSGRGGLESCPMARPLARVELRGRRSTFATSGADK